PGRFRCAPDAICFPREWLCDGHPDCDDEGDERGCGTATPVEPGPGGAGVAPARSSAVPPSGNAGTGGEGFSACALSSLVLLSILVTVASVAVWGLSKAKSRSDIFSIEKASREQLIPDRSQ
ncbi:RSVR protein, partial [Nyctibius bracteatus]|nr:RSVR protein [Nyctibius bracteatus]